MARASSNENVAGVSIGEDAERAAKPLSGAQLRRLGFDLQEKVALFSDPKSFGRIKRDQFTTLLTKMKDAVARAGPVCGGEDRDPEVAKTCEALSLLERAMPLVAALDPEVRRVAMIM